MERAVDEQPEEEDMDTEEAKHPMEQGNVEFQQDEQPEGNHIMERAMKKDLIKSGNTLQTLLK